MPIRMSSKGIEFGNSLRPVSTGNSTDRLSYDVDATGFNGDSIWYQDQPNPGMPGPYWGNDSSGNGWAGQYWIKPHHYGYYYSSNLNTPVNNRVLFFPIYVDTGFKGDKLVTWLEINVSQAYSFGSGGALKAALYDTDLGDYHSNEPGRLGGCGLPKTKLCEFNFTSSATTTGSKAINSSPFETTVYRGWYFLAFMVYNITAGSVRGSYGGSGSNTATMNSYSPYVGAQASPTSYPQRCFFQTASNSTFSSNYSVGNTGGTHVVPYFALGLSEV